MSDPVVKKWQGWRRQKGTRTWLPVKEAVGDSKGDAYQRLMEGELTVHVVQYEYMIMPEGETPAAVPTYSHRMERPKGL